MKKMSRFLATMVISLIWVFPSQAAAKLKIGYVDLQQALQETSAGKKAKGELEVEFKKKKKDLESTEAALKKQREEIEKKKDLLSKSALEKKAGEFQQQMLQYREMMAKSQMEIQQRERELTAPILRQLGDVISNLAKKEGYDMILEKSQQGIVWAKREMDITAKVISMYEKQKTSKK